ncbi:MAG: hypothetical protein ACO2O0_10460 [Desulfurococcales archaeon]
MEEEEIPENFLNAIKEMIRGFKKAKGYISNSDRESIEEGFVSLIADMLHSWMKSNNIDPDQAAIRIEIEEEEVDVELPRRIRRFRL